MKLHDPMWPASAATNLGCADILHVLYSAAFVQFRCVRGRHRVASGRSEIRHLLLTAPASSCLARADILSLMYHANCSIQVHSRTAPRCWRPQPPATSTARCRARAAPHPVAPPHEPARRRSRGSPRRWVQSIHSRRRRLATIHVDKPAMADILTTSTTCDFKDTTWWPHWAASTAATCRCCPRISA